VVLFLFFSLVVPYLFDQSDEVDVKGKIYYSQNGEVDSLTYDFIQVKVAEHPQLAQIVKGYMDDGIISLDERSEFHLQLQFIEAVETAEKLKSTKRLLILQLEKLK